MDDRRAPRSVEERARQRGLDRREAQADTVAVLPRVLARRPHHEREGRRGAALARRGTELLLAAHLRHALLSGVVARPDRLLGEVGPAHDLRRVLLYEEFVGFPLRKDYPIERTQPLIPYRQVEGLSKLPPFGMDEGQPWGRIQWQERLAGRDNQVSPAIAVQVGQKRALSETSAREGNAEAEE